MGFNVQGAAVVRESIEVKRPAYTGVSEFCGILGNALTTDRYIPKPEVKSDARGEYVEVRSLLGSRVGVYIPDIDVSVPVTASWSDIYFMGSPLLIQHFAEEFVELMAEEKYTGTSSAVPKIYDYIRLKAYADGSRVGEYVTEKAGNGFQSTAEIIKHEIGYSWVPEHHLYLDDDLVRSITPQSTDGYDEWLNWADSYRPFEVFATAILAQSLTDWCRNATDEELNAVAVDFKNDYPGYYVGTTW